jgi:hypothetical protein
MHTVLLTINPETGTIEKKTIVSGSLSKTGYLRIRYGGKPEYVHRLIWEHVNGPIPKGMYIDHINGNPSDNRICNLRLVTPHQNTLNRRRSNTSIFKSPYRGVRFVKSNEKWVASISLRGKKTHLGYFETAELAKSAYIEASIRMHTHSPYSKTS